MHSRPTSEYALCAIGVLFGIITFLVAVHCIKKILFSNKHRIADKHIFVQPIDKYKRRSKQHIKKKNVEISFDPYLRFGTILSLICCFITLCGYLSTMFIIADTVPHTMEQLLLNDTFLIILHIKSFTWHFSRIAVNFVFVQRLQSSFKDTQWAYSYRVFYGLRFMLLLLLILTLLTSVIRVLIVTHNTEMTPRILITLHIYFVMLDIIFVIFLTVLFHKRVFELIEAYYVLYRNSVQKQLNLNEIHFDDMLTAEESLSLPTKSGEAARSASISDEKRGDDVVQMTSLAFCPHISDSRRLTGDLYENIHEQRLQRKHNLTKHIRYGHTEKELINSIVQHSTLVSVSVISSMFVLIYCINGFIGRFQVHQTAPSIECSFGGQMLVVIECFINSLCLYLQFPFAFRLYHGLCCAHKVCIGCVTKCVEKCVEK